MNSEWEILVMDSFIKNAKKLRVLDRALKFLDELERDLEKDPNHTLQYLERQSRVGRIGDKILRRVRMGRYRLFYFIDHKTRRIIFIDIRIRKETRKTYRF